MANEELLKSIFDKNPDLDPVLSDIGSSGMIQEIFKPLAPYATIVGFDPDYRGQDSAFSQGFKNSHMVPAAVTADAKEEEVEFILTKYPSCSSTLEPDLNALDDYIFRDLFEPVDKVKARATTLNKTLSLLKFKQFDWIKVDSQGTDLRILKSIKKSALDGLMAVDIEPGVIAAYLGEDYFTDVHNWLISKGFWLCDIRFQQYTRVNPENYSELESMTDISEELTIEKLMNKASNYGSNNLNKLIKSKILDKYKNNEDFKGPEVKEVIKPSPTAAEARYFRTNSFLRENRNDKRSLMLATVFALVDDQLGFAYDVVKIYESIHGKDEFVTSVKEGIVNTIKERKLLKADQILKSYEYTNVVVNKAVGRAKHLIKGTLNRVLR